MKTTTWKWNTANRITEIAILVSTLGNKFESNTGLRGIYEYCDIRHHPLHLTADQVEELRRNYQAAVRDHTPQLIWLAGQGAFKEFFAAYCDDMRPQIEFEGGIVSDGDPRAIQLLGDAISRISRRRKGTFLEWWDPFRSSYVMWINCAVGLALRQQCEQQIHTHYQRSLDDSLTNEDAMESWYGEPLSNLLEAIVQKEPSEEELERIAARLNALEAEAMNMGMGRIKQFGLRRQDVIAIIRRVAAKYGLRPDDTPPPRMPWFDPASQFRRSPRRNVDDSTPELALLA
jgi:hypothetical protein